MVKSCVAYGCTNRWTTGSGIQFHTFPHSKPELLKKWVQRIRRENWTPTKYSYICSEHFTKESYIFRPGADTQLLRDDAAPTVFSFPHLQTKIKPPVSENKRKQAQPARRQKAIKLEKPELPLEEPELLSPERKCFVCSKGLGLTGSPLTDVTNTTKTKLHQKLSKVIAAELDSVVVDENGVICNGCCSLLNYLDRIEVEHRLLTKSVVDCMRWTSGLGAVRDESRMPEAVLASIEDHGKKIQSPVETGNHSLDVPAQDTSDVAVSWSETVATSDTDNKQKIQKLPEDRVTEKKKKQILPVDRITENEKKQTIPVERVPEKKKIQIRVVDKVTVKKTDSDQDKQNYHCKVCNFESKHKSVFLFHLQRHRQSGYRCDFCDVLLPKDLSYWIARMQKQCKNS